MDDARHTKSSMHPTIVLELDDELKKVNKKTYRGMIGSLLYLIGSRHDIMFSVCLYADSKRNQGKFIYLMLNGYLDI